MEVIPSELSVDHSDGLAPRSRLLARVEFVGIARCLHMSSAREFWPRNPWVKGFVEAWGR